ncbi:MAG: hypothetical protein ACJA09_003420 [Alcanivorax sp.]|jgi:hypothetical protein
MTFPDEIHLLTSTIWRGITPSMSELMTRLKKYSFRVYRETRNRLQVSIIPTLLALKISLFFPFRRSGIRHNLPAPLIVSLTSYPARFPSLHLTLKCLLSQSVKPDDIILWIAHADKELLTDRIMKLQSAGLIIHFCDDLLSFKKIIPTLERYADCYIVTADDDVYYGASWLKNLVDSSSSNPRDVICHRAHRIRLGLNSVPLPYDKWISDPLEFDATPLTFQTGVGGVLYPPKIFHSDVLNIDLFTELCFSADDIWLFWMMRMNNAFARRASVSFRVHYWPGTQQSALWRHNVERCNNDVQIGNMIKHYGTAIFEDIYD